MPAHTKEVHAAHTYVLHERGYDELAAKFFYMPVARIAVDMFLQCFRRCLFTPVSACFIAGCPLNSTIITPSRNLHWTHTLCVVQPISSFAALFAFTVSVVEFAQHSSHLKCRSPLADTVMCRCLVELLSCLLEAGSPRQRSVISQVLGCVKRPAPWLTS